MGRVPSRSTVYLVNVKGKELASYYQMHKKCETIGYGQIKSVKACSVLVIEDIITMKKEEEIELRKAINYTAHHKLSKIFCITHTVYNTGLYSMLPLFNYLIFTGSPSNTPIVRHSLSYFKIEKTLVANWLGQLKKIGGQHPHSYFFLDCTKMIFCLSKVLLEPKQFVLLGSLTGQPISESQSALANQGSASELTGGEKDSRPGEMQWKLVVKNDNAFWQSSRRAKATEWQSSGAEPSNSKAESEKISQLKKKFADFFSGHKHHQQGSAIFATLVETLGPHRIDSKDLTVGFLRRASLPSSTVTATTTTTTTTRIIKNPSLVLATSEIKEKSGRYRRVSTVDYVDALLHETDERPDLDLLVLHQYVGKHCQIPLSCIKNKHFLKTAR